MEFCFLSELWLLEFYWEAAFFLSFLLNPNIDHFQVCLWRMVTSWGADCPSAPPPNSFTRGLPLGLSPSLIPERETIYSHLLFASRVFRHPYPCWLSSWVAGDSCVSSCSSVSPCVRSSPAGCSSDMLEVWMGAGRNVLTEGPAAGVSAPTHCV